jgi:hypothetical protein
MDTRSRPTPHVKVNSPPVIHETIDGEVIVINLATGTYYSLRGTAASAWELVQRPAGAAHVELVTALAAKFDAPEEQIDTSVASFVAELESEGLVIAGEPSSASADTATVNGYGVNAAKRPFEPPMVEKYTDMQDLVLLDPVHEVEELGWPHARPDAGTR